MIFIEIIWETIKSVGTNEYLRIAVISMMIAQTTKLFTGLIQTKRIDLRLLGETGGMPSSHTSTVVALAGYIGIHQGYNSPIFALAVIFSAIVMCDATGIRQNAGKQAELVNKLVDDLVHVRGVREGQLKEILGHTPMEVFGGFVLGIAVAGYLG